MLARGTEVTVVALATPAPRATATPVAAYRTHLQVQAVGATEPCLTFAAPAVGIFGNGGHQRNWTVSTCALSHIFGLNERATDCEKGL